MIQFLAPRQGFSSNARRALLVPLSVCLLAIAEVPALADVTPSPTSSDVAVPIPVIQRAWQETWNTVHVKVRSDAQHWTLRSCPTAQDPTGAVLGEGTKPQEVTVNLVKTFDWAVVDSPPMKTFCAQAVSDDGAGNTSRAVRTSVDVSFDVTARSSYLDGSPIVQVGRRSIVTFDVFWGPSWDRRSPRKFVRGAPLELRYRTLPRGKWTSLGRFTSDQNGAVTVLYRHEDDTLIQACRPGTSCGTVLASQTDLTQVRVLSSAPAKAHRNTTFPIYGTVLPRYAGRPVQLCENHGSKECRPVSTKRTDARGRVVFSVHAGSKITSRSWRLCSPVKHHGFWGDFCSEAPVRNVRIR